MKPSKIRRKAARQAVRDEALRREKVIAEIMKPTIRLESEIANRAKNLNP